jgi:hypothetical protein
MKNLRILNKQRQAEWDPSDQITLAYRGNELAGEVGEMLERALDLLLIASTVGRISNVIKKLERERLGIRGSRTTPEQLGEEMADAIICLDLAAMHMGINLNDAVIKKFNATSDAMGLKTHFVGDQV